MSNTTNCHHCGHTLLTRDVHHYRDYDGAAICWKCFDSFGYRYVGLTPWGTPKFRY